MKDDGRYYTKEKGRERLAKGVEMTDSIYYWWFEYLKRSDFYKKACGISVELTDRQEKEYSKWMKEYGNVLLEDFGYVFRGNFWDWWTDKDQDDRRRGARLFGIKPITQLADFVSIDDVLAIKGEVSKGNFRLVAIPTNLNKATIRRRISRLIKELEVTPTGEQRAKYHPAQLKVDAESLRFCLDAYDMKKDGKTNIEIGAYFLCNEMQMRELIRDGRKMGKSYETEALKLHLGSMGVEEYDKMIESGGDTFAFLSAGKQRTAKKNYLNVKASRMVKKATANIRAVERGVFPLGH